MRSASPRRIFLRGEESRSEDDVLFQDLFSADFPQYLFEVNDFNASPSAESTCSA